MVISDKEKKRLREDFYNLKSPDIKKLVSEIKRDLRAAEKRNDFKDIANCKVALEKLENHPSRFSDLFGKLGKGEVDLGTDKSTLETIKVALQLASKYQQLSDQNLNLSFEKMKLLQLGTDSSIPYQKRLTEVGRMLGLTTNSKGKKTPWPPSQLGHLKEIYVRLIDSGFTRKDAVLEIFNEPKNKGLFSSPNQCSKMLSKTGLKNIPNMAYLSKNPS